MEPCFSPTALLGSLADKDTEDDDDHDGVLLRRSGHRAGERVNGDHDIIT